MKKVENIIHAIQIIGFAILVIALIFLWCAKMFSIFTIQIINAIGVGADNCMEFIENIQDNLFPHGNSNGPEESKQ